MPPFSGDKGLLLVKSEATYGVDPTPTAALNAVAVEALTPKADPTLLQRDVLRDTLSLPKDIVARTLAGITFTFELKGAGGAVDVPPRYGPILKAAGFGETVGAGVSVVYAFVNSAQVSCTIYAYMDGVLQKLLGCFARRLTIREEVNKFLKCEVEMAGFYVAPTDAAIASGAVFDPSVPLPIQNIGATFGGYAPVIPSIEFTLDTGLSTREDLHAANGCIGYVLGRRTVTGKIDPEAVTEATHSYWANFAAGTSVALAANTIGTVVGNRVALNAPAVQYDGPQWGLRERFRTYGVGLRFRATTDAASDEFSIVTT
jgi:hypothetical protein